MNKKEKYEMLYKQVLSLAEVEHLATFDETDQAGLEKLAELQ